MKIIFLSFTSLLIAITSYAQNALNFDGADDHILTDTWGVTGNSARTIEARIRTTSNALPINSGGTGQKVIVDWGTFVTGGRSTFNVLWNNAIRFEVGGSGLSGSIAINDGLWHHVACVIDPMATNTISLYVDGVLDIAGNIPTTINSGLTNKIRIGRRVDNVNPFEGDIDEVRVWNIAKTQAELQADMSNELCTFPSSLILYCPLNEGTANGMNSTVTEANDYSTNNSTCTLSGFGLTGVTSNWVNGFAHGPGFTIAPDTDVIACGSYFWTVNNQFYPSSTYDQAVVTPSMGCASIVGLNLTINQNSSSSETVSECSSYTWPQNGQTYTNSGVYTDTVPNAVGCDSIISLNLTITGPNNTTENVSACQQYTWPLNGQTYNSSATATTTVLSSQGCDSTVTLNLTISNTNSVTQTVSSCGDYFWSVNGAIYSAAGMYTATLTNINGCDSVITLDLSIIPFDNTITAIDETTLSANQSNAQYQWINCSNNAPILGETNQTLSASTAGSYAAIITTDNCSDTSNCIQLSTASLPLNETISFAVVPNPTRGLFEIKGGLNQGDFIYLRDTQGKLIISKKIIHPNTEQLDVTYLNAGIYFLQIETSLGVYTLRLNKHD